MTRAVLVAWLEARRPPAPVALRARLTAVVEGAVDADLPLPDHLALLGERVLAGVVGRPEGGRELALDLLAADAFVTYAFEAQSETDARGLAMLAERVAKAGDPVGGRSA
ncbi:MAG TPA: hypothetical protein VM716_14490 [Gemmatimonadales bacterium]|nr:hypothetical protein [Gemmatimonadales bacterium]